ncbi:MAG TPA: membrane protein insertase YidC [Thermoanaerobaculia bacterium]|nr:membrane protein insertase YidC [Thermoanaerobaculia bacterium]
MDNRRLFIAALLSLAVLLGWQALFPPPERPGVEAPAPSAAAPAPGSGSLPAEGGAAAPPSAGAATASPGAAPPAGLSAEAIAEPIAAEREREYAVETGALTAVFTNRGAELRSLRLKSDLEGLADGIELVQGRDEGPYPFAFATAGGGLSPLAAALFAVEESTGEDGERRLVFRYRGPEGEAEKRFRFRADGLVAVEAEARGLADGWSLLLGPGLRQLPRERLESRFERRAGAWSAGGELGTLAPVDATTAKEIPGTGLSWVGIEDTYFLVAAVPASPLRAAVFDPVLLAPGSAEGRWRAVPAPPKPTDEQKEWPRDLRVRLLPEGNTLAVVTYWGAKEYNRLVELPYGLEKSVRWGMFGFLARPLLWGLHWLHDSVVANWGWAIVLMTIVLKIVLLPLTLTAYASMQKMQRLNPKIQAIRERYRPKLRDKQGKMNSEAQRQMNEEVMALYKAEGVNPAGGCLPILLQIPVFFAFYTLLSASVELWHAPWIGWIHDLSAKDPYYVLPILMGVTQVIQQKMTPAAADPIQRRMFQLFPIIFTVFSLGFPSGLVLYWLVNNILTIIQQAIQNAVRPPVAPAAPARRGGKS